MSLLLYGYFGHRNFGDDLLLSIACRLCRDIGYKGKIDVASDSKGVDYLPGIVSGFDDIVPMTQNAHRWIWRKYDHVLFAGGGTVFDYRKSMSKRYRLKNHLSDSIRFGLPRLTGTRYASMGVGIGPFASAAGKRVAMHRLRYHDWLFVRDQDSLEHAASVCKGDTTLSVDLSLLEASRLSELARSLECRGQVVGILVRSYRFGDVGNRYLEAVRHAAEILVNQGVEVQWLSFQPDYDNAVLDMLSSNCQTWTWDPDTMTFEDAYQKIASLKTLVTARMHGTYVAGMLGVPTVGIELHPKIRLAAEEFSNTSVLSATSSGEKIATACQELSGMTSLTDLKRIDEEETRLRQRLTDWLSN